MSSARNSQVEVLSSVQRFWHAACAQRDGLNAWHCLLWYKKLRNTSCQAVLEEPDLLVSIWAQGHRWCLRQHQSSTFPPQTSCFLYPTCSGLDSGWFECKEMIQWCQGSTGNSTQGYLPSRQGTCLSESKSLQRRTFIQCSVSILLSGYFVALFQVCGGRRAWWWMG